MSALLWLSSMRYLLKRPWQTALSVLGITLGVAVVVAIDLGNQSAKRAFRLSGDAVAGKTTHQVIGGPGGLPEHFYYTLRVDMGVKNSAPVVEGYAYMRDGRALRILGVDPFADAQFRPYTGGSSYIGASSAPIRYTAALLAEPATALMSVQTAETMGLRTGDAFTAEVAGVVRSISIVGLITPHNDLSRASLKDLLITDISTAQELTEFEGRLSRIDLIVPSGEQGEILERIRSALPSEAALVSAASRSDAVEQLTGSFDDNLFVVSLLGLIVGAFLIYNTMTFSVVRRHRVIGALRALGVTRQQIFALLLSEALLIGIISSVIGILLGILIGRGILYIITQTISDLFFVVSIQELAIPVWSLAKGALLGIAATLTAAFAPALEATGAPPGRALSRSRLEARFKGAVPLTSCIGISLIAVGAVLIFLPAGTLNLTFIGLAALVLGYAILTPACVLFFSRMLAPLLGSVFGAMGAMAARGIAASLSRTAVAIAALAVAISITISIDTMVRSFRGTVEQWLDNSLSSDIYISPASFRSNGTNVGLSPQVLERIQAVEGIERVSAVRNARVHSPNGDVEILALDTPYDNFIRYNSFKEGNPALIWADLQSGDAVAVSEPYAYHNDKDVGSTIRLSTSEGDRDFRVAGIYYDYRNSGSGRVMMSRSAYERFWDDDKFSGIGVNTAAGVSLDDLTASIERAIGGEREVAIRSNAELKAAAMAVFDRSFTITSVVRVLSISVAFVGVLSALMALQLERAFEIGALRAIGFTPKQVWLLFTSQTGLMGVIAGLLSLPLGLIQAAVLIFVVNRRSFGWSMDMEIYPLALLQAVVIAVVAALLASIYPASAMSRSSPARALHEE